MPGGRGLCQRIAPGHPAVFGTWPFVSDLRTGAMSGGSGEQALLTAGCAQMHRFYGLPGGAAAGISDSKLPDMQAGWEQASPNVMAGLAGSTWSMRRSACTPRCSASAWKPGARRRHLGQALRCVRGIEVTEDSVSLEAMRSVCLDGPGHYLILDQSTSPLFDPVTDAALRAAFNIYI
jgi:trimethylamine--corrinoid protein Co-methyltransferase